VRHALFVPLFGELSDPIAVADLAARAEAKGWDGFFVWDHLLYREPVELIADPWVALAAVACATERLVLGPMVTPLARRRPQKLARETVTLDHLSRGRLVLGVGLGGDAGGELRAFGEELDASARARMLDEGLELLARMWSGDRVEHTGPRFRADGVVMRPPAVQRPRIPVWVASVWPHRKPLRRVARWDGWFPINLDAPEQLAEAAAEVASIRDGSALPLDVAVQGLPGVDPWPWQQAGATWWLVRFEPWSPTVAEVGEVLDEGPPAR
jgi:alkanesulfonate monooxygenase SsuD/methylene tetrahydromethanopterin reductase-like flavin-dependent oxidoreductase (luciferase family)